MVRNAHSVKLLHYFFSCFTLNCLPLKGNVREYIQMIIGSENLLTFLANALIENKFIDCETNLNIEACTTVHTSYMYKIIHSIIT